MDGKMCTTLPGVWEPYEQTWESNRSIRMQNVGAADVINPWLTIGPIDFFTQQTIADSVVKGLSIGADACEVKLTEATDATRFAAGDYAAIYATTTGYVNPVS